MLIGAGQREPTMATVSDSFPGLRRAMRLFSARFLEPRKCHPTQPGP